jgi:hypothetical protein
LNAQPRQQPPVGLAARIVEQIRLPARDTMGKSRFSLAGLLASFQPAPVGLAFAAGLLVTVALYEVAGPGSQETDFADMVGTMIADPDAGAGTPENTVTIAQAGIAGSVSLGDMGSYLVMSFDLEAAGGSEVVVDLAEAGLSFGGIAHAAAGGSADSESFTVAGGALRVANQGRQRFTVFLRRAEEQGLNGRSVDFEVSHAGGNTFRGSLRLGDEGA